MINTSQYLHLILVPTAQAFRDRWEQESPFKATRTMKQCRVEFLDGNKDKLWQKFCVDNGLKNDTSLEY